MLKRKVQHELTLRARHSGGRINRHVAEHDALARAYARLVALHDVLVGLTDEFVSPAPYVNEFQTALHALAKAGIDVKEFGVSARDVRSKGAFENPFYFSSPFEALFVRRALLLVRIKTVINYFAISSSESREPQPIGFLAPQQEIHGLRTRRSRTSRSA